MAIGIGDDCGYAPTDVATTIVVSACIGRKLAAAMRERTKIKAEVGVEGGTTACKFACSISCLHKAAEARCCFSICAWRSCSLAAKAVYPLKEITLGLPREALRNNPESVPRILRALFNLPKVRQNELCTPMEKTESCPAP